MNKQLKTPILITIAEAIKELKSVPSGHLYAQLMGYFSLEEYQDIIDILKLSKLIKVENHLVTYIGE